MLKTMLCAAAVSLAALAPAVAGPVYDGQLVTLIVPHSPGGGMSQYARMLAPYIAKHSGAREVRIENHPGAGGVLGANLVDRADPDGMTIGFATVSGLIFAQLAESPGVRYDIGALTFLGRAANEPRLLVVGKTFPYKTLNELVADKRQFIAPSQGMGDDFFALAVLADGVGFSTKTITGFEGEPDITLATVKGDGDGFISAYENLRPSLQSGDVRGLLTLADEPHPVLTEVPTLGSVLGGVDPAKAETVRAMVDILSTARGFFGPAGMDTAARDEMRDAIAAALADPELIAASRTMQLPLNGSPGAAEQERAARIIASSDALKPVMKAAIEQIR